VPAFCWFSTRTPPPEFDLGLSGWDRLSAGTWPGSATPDDCAILIDQSWIGSGERLIMAAAPAARARALVLGVQSSGERARLLTDGFGDALPPGAALAEVEQRALRLLGSPGPDPLLRRAGPVVLDLALRDGWIAGRRLALHPLEFALIWRMAESCGSTVCRAELLRDVWKLAFDPGTNRVEVHISRLRRKLLQAGVRGLVETSPQGGYRLARAQQSAGPEAPIGQSRAGLPGEDAHEFPRPCRGDDREPCRPRPAQPAGQDECA